MGIGEVNLKQENEDVMVICVLTSGGLRCERVKRTMCMQQPLDLGHKQIAGQEYDDDYDLPRGAKKIKLSREKEFQQEFGDNYFPLIDFSVHQKKRYVDHV